MANFEQGPIRPPSEAASLLVRVSRNCPWNRCAFCSIYKGKRFSLRPVAEVLADLDALREEVGTAPRTVFLQDANPLLTRTADLVAILEGIRQRFPAVTRITAYARSHTLARRPVEELVRLRQAGLDRLHVGMESGCDAVLELVGKGTTRLEQIEGGRRAKAAGFELSEYVMPGLGGRELTAAHADDTASALEAIRPDFIRLRTTALVPRTELFQLWQEGRFTQLTEVELLQEIRRLLLGLTAVSARLESDHILNLLMEIRGDLPGDLPQLQGLCDRILGLPEPARNRFILARRMGYRVDLQDLEETALVDELDRLLEQSRARGIEPEALFASLRMRMV